MTKPAIDLLVVGARQVVTCAGHARPARGEAQARANVLENVAVAVGGDTLLAVGPEDELRRAFSTEQTRVVDAQGGVVLPGFVDAHTHMVFANDRADEWEQRMQGVPYLDLLRAGGGILRTVRDTRQASFAELLAGATRWAQRMLSLGTTTVEIKSGYGLTRADEIKLLEVARALGVSSGLSVVSTFLGAHVVPPEFAHDRAGYLSLVEETAEEVARRKLADFVDVFCENEAFTLTETERVLRHGQKLGLGLKLHAEQFSGSGATALAVRLGATSVDHLEHVSGEDLARLGAHESPPIAVLLPGVVFHLGMHTYAPARRLIDTGAPVALATDFNPGSSFTPSMPMAIALACRFLGMSVAEALVASTINAAHALGVAHRVGSLEAGKRADMVIADIPDYRWLGYAFGYNPVQRVILGGALL